jgi:hypothetical protein
MNATQGKAVLAITNQALSLLERSGHPLAPRYVVELRERLSATIAIQAVARKPKSARAIETAQRLVEDAAWRLTGESVQAFVHRVLERFRAGATRIKDFDAIAKAKTLVDSTESDAVKARLALCACGGYPSDHEEDDTGNLLKCTHCDTCDHFHYEVNASQDEAA